MLWCWAEQTRHVVYPLTKVNLPILKFCCVRRFANRFEAGNLGRQSKHVPCTAPKSEAPQRSTTTCREQAGTHQPAELDGGEGAPTTKPPTTEDIDTRSASLILEFDKHKAEVAARMGAKYPDRSPDERKIFEGWILQKVASLQVLVEHYEQILGDLLIERERMR